MQYITEILWDIYYLNQIHTHQDIGADIANAGDTQGLGHWGHWRPGTALFAH